MDRLDDDLDGLDEMEEDDDRFMFQLDGLAGLVVFSSEVLSPLFTAPSQGGEPSRGQGNFGGAPARKRPDPSPGTSPPCAATGCGWEDFEELCGGLLGNPTRHGGNGNSRANHHGQSSACHVLSLEMTPSPVAIFYRLTFSTAYPRLHSTAGQHQPGSREPRS